MQSLADIDFANKVALVRADLNVPLDKETNTITDDTRIQASIPTIKAILDNGGSCVVMSHLGRPTEGEINQSLSLQPVATQLGSLLGKDVNLQTLETAKKPEVGEVILLENTRFNVGEKANSTELASKYAQLGDVFVMDAFASAHRAESSTAALAKTANQCCAGLLMDKEISSLAKAIKEPARPLLSIVGGAKISTKLTVIDNLAKLSDVVMVGGGIANTFLAANGHEVGNSLVETDMLDICKELVSKHGNKIQVPIDVVVAKSFNDTKGKVASVSEVSSDEMILDAGPVSLADYKHQVENAGTIIWNGALGVFENEAFANGTKQLALSIGNAKGFSLAGGGETVAAAKLYEVVDKINCVSTGGGAFLEYIEGKVLPGLEALQ